ncbi:MAG: Regulator of chromosome condensation (RCC1) repeat protein [Syntrophaceae bacterium PtaU1.Bin231]|nr:MAG: Regulator of chromosome condensation (RCC1) repeat protein [Syntrophaceae bacterium PtaU1.Bin231]
MESLDAGLHHACAVLTDTFPRCWGRNDFQQLGDGTTENRSTPVFTSLSRGVLQVAAGLTHTCALADDRSVWCWGSNASGQLGDGTTESKVVPVEVVP